MEERIEGLNNAHQAIVLWTLGRANTVAEKVKVMLATMHLVDDIKLWWRSKYMDIQDGRCTMDTWECLKQELHS